MAHRTTHATRAVNKNGVGKDGFTEGQTTPTPIAATVVTEDILNMLQEEVVGTVEASGITPTAGTFTQLLGAIKRFINAAILTNWYGQSMAAVTDHIRDVIYANGLWYAVGDTGRTASLVVGAGAWTTAAVGAGNWYGIAYNNSVHCIVGAAGAIRTSPDFVTWTTRTSGTAQDLRSVAWNGSQFVAVGGNGTILTSPDGTTWTARTSGTTNVLFCVAWGNSTFVAVGGSGTILTSTDGITWTSRTSGSAASLYRAIYNGSIWVVSGSSGTILTSSNLTTWTSRTSGTGNALYGLVYLSGIDCIVAVGDSSVVRTSFDGITWTNRFGTIVSGTGTWFGVAYGDNRVGVVGTTGAAIFSFRHG